MKIAPHVFAFALAASVVAVAPGAGSGLHAQEVGDENGRLALYPLVGIGTYGDRFRERADGPSRLAPASGPMFGAGAAYRVLPRVSVAVSGTYSRLSYDIRDQTDVRSVGGRQKLVRVTAGTQLRVRPQVPGYFSFGVGAARFEPVRPIYARDEIERTEVGGYAGVGMDVIGERHALRVEGRFYLSSPNTEGVTGNFGVVYDPRSFVPDFTLTMAFVVRL